MFCTTAWRSHARIAWSVPRWNRTGRQRVLTRYDTWLYAVGEDRTGKRSQVCPWKDAWVSELDTEASFWQPRAQQQVVLMQQQQHILLDPWLININRMNTSSSLSKVQLYYTDLFLGVCLPLRENKCWKLLRELLNLQSSIVKLHLYTPLPFTTLNTCQQEYSFQQYSISYRIYSLFNRPGDLSSINIFTSMTPAESNNLISLLHNQSEYK